MSIKPTFQGEVQFRRWSDSSTQGVQVTFALHDSEALEPLKAKAGKRFMAVLVEIGDDELPVQPPPEPEPKRNGWSEVGPKCREAIDLSNNAEFQKYIGVLNMPRAPLAASEWIKAKCKVSSRVELDSDPEAYARFTKLVRGPYLASLRERQAA